jgi:Ni,Fe-hydrogenase III small subunit/formate hydrogenlyase subunit 6/NADH:ubiquinone oxidoreductase subunit I
MVDKKGKQAKGAGQADSKPHGDILGNQIETIRDPIGNTHASPNYRGSVSLMAKEVLLDLAKYEEVEGVCSPKAIKITEADGKKQTHVTLDMGKCILCGRCQEAAPDLFKVESRFMPSTKKRQELIESLGEMPPTENKSYETIGKELRDKVSRMFGRSLAVREVDAGSCNGCEVEITALNNPIYDIERFGIHFVASPRHADVLLVTGPASRNMEVALKRTYEATSDPKIVVAVGACACSGGIFGDTYATTGGIDKVVPVDVYIPGCPPRPEALLYGLLSAVDRIHLKVNKKQNPVS